MLPRLATQTATEQNPSRSIITIIDDVSNLVHIDPIVHLMRLSRVAGNKYESVEARGPGVVIDQNFGGQWSETMDMYTTFEVTNPQGSRGRDPLHLCHTS